LVKKFKEAMKPYERDAIEQHRIDLQHELGIVKSELSFNNDLP